MFKFSEKDAVRWEKIREKGKWFYVARKAIIMTALFMVTSMVSNLIVGEPVEIKALYLIFSPIVGFLVALAAWWSSDANYQTYVLDRKIEKGLKVDI